MISKISKYFFLFLFFITSICNLRAQQLQNIKGKVSETLVNLPIENATIQIDDKQAISDKNGFFEVFGVSLGRKEIKVSCVGYKTQIIKEVLVESGKESTIEITLSPVLKELGLLEVKAASSNPNGAISSIESINMEQVFRYPATFFDPARLAFSFAGVANANDQANAMVGYRLCPRRWGMQLVTFRRGRTVRQQFIWAREYRCSRVHISTASIFGGSGTCDQFWAFNLEHRHANGTL